MLKGSDKRGLSTIVATLLIILLVLVAVGIIWLVIKNVILSGTEQISLGKLTLSLDIESISRDVSENSMDIKIKRNSGEGDLFGLAFIAEEENNSEIIKIKNISLSQFETKTFRNVNLSSYMNVSKLKKVSVAPIFILKSGKEVVGDIADVYLFSAMLETSETICNDTCASFNYTCGTQNICGDATNCGTCPTGYNCNILGQCMPSCTDTCESLNYTCGTYSICGVSTTCWGCSDGEICNQSTCTPCQGAGCVSSCGALSTSGQTYFLTSNVNSVRTCLNIAAPNVVLDCQNRWITYSTDGEQYTDGIDVTQFNTTIKNCNILDGNWNSGAGNFRIGIYFAITDNSTLFNNFINTSNSPGIYLNHGTTFNNITKNRIVSDSGIGIYLFSDSDNNVLIDNTAKSNLGTGIIIYNSSGNNLMNNNGVSHSSAGIALTMASYNRLTNNIGISNSSNGIFLSESFNNVLIGNNGTSNSSNGIFLSDSYQNILINNNGTSNSSNGIFLLNASESTLTNNIGTSNLNPGIYITSSSENTLTNNIGTSNSSNGIFLLNASESTLTNNIGTSNYAVGIWLYTSLNNLLTNNIATSKLDEGIRLQFCSNNTFIGQTSRTLGITGSTRYGVYIQSSNNTIFRDCKNITGATKDIYYASNTGSVNNTFINCSYNTETVQGTGNELIRKWYYRAYVNDTSGNVIANAGIYATNNLGINQFAKLTSSSGWISTQELTDYINSGGTKTYYSNYVITANKTGYTAGIKNYNITLNRNNLNDFFTLSV